MSAPELQDAWHYFTDEQQLGPVSAQELSQMILNGEVSPDVLCWCPSLEGWQPAHSVPELNQREGETRKPKLKLVSKRSSDEEASRVASSLPLDGESAKPVPEPESMDIKALLADNVNLGATSVQESTQVAGGKSLLLKEESVSSGRSFEFTFFTVCLMLAFICTPVTYYLAPDYVPLPSAGLGFLCVVAGALIFRVRTFQENVWWGVGGLFTGISDLFFISMHWERSWRSLLLMAAGAFFSFAAINFGYDYLI